MVVVYGIKMPGIHFQYQNNAQMTQKLPTISYETIGQICLNNNRIFGMSRTDANENAQCKYTV
jgi:hypothetical protein